MLVSSSRPGSVAYVKTSAASRISRILRRQPGIDSTKVDGLTLHANIGNIVMKDAEFSYPNRKHPELYLML